MSSTVYEIVWGKDKPFQVSNVIWQNGEAVNDFTGWEVWFTIKRDPNDPDPGLLQKKLSTGGIQAYREQLNTKISASESRTLFAPNTIYYFDLQAKDRSDAVDTLYSGRLVFVNDITKST